MKRAATESVSVSANRRDCYAVRVVGPAGHVTYLNDAFAAGLAAPHETDDPAQARRFHNPINAWAASEVYAARHEGCCRIAVDVVNLDDPEDRCHE